METTTSEAAAVSADSGELDAAAAQVLGVSPDKLQEYARANGLQVNAPARPELQPGESVTTVPDRFCEQCAQPRGGRRCQVCRALTVRVQEIEEAEEYEPERLPRRGARQAPPERGDYEEIGGEMFLGRPRGASARGRQMTMRSRNRGDEDDERVVHISPNRRQGRGRKRTAEDMLSDMWVMQTINLPCWWAAYAALIGAHKPQTPEELAQLATLADAAYIEMMARQQSG